jgi:hypothetical protein
MRIYFNGDSHTFGSELPVGTGFAYKLANLLNAEIMDNKAIGGYGNDRIMRTTQDSLREWIASGNRPDLVIIGWSEFLRMDWFWDGEYLTAPCDLLEPKTCLDADTNRFNYLTKIVKQSGARPFMARYFHERIYNFHQELDSWGIPHLFFSAVESFQSAIYTDIHKYLTMEYINTGDPTNLYHYNWKESYYKPYGNDSSFLEWGISNGFKITQKKHLEEKAHDEFALLLKSHIEENFAIS